MRRNKTALVIWLLVLIILILLILVAYVFLIQPAIVNYTINKQSQGAQIAVDSILREVVQCKIFPLQVGNETINLVALECLDLPATT